MASDDRWGRCTWEAICRICTQNKTHQFTREQVVDERHTIRNCAKGHGEHPEVTSSFQLTECTKLGFIFQTDRGEYHLTDWGMANFRVFQKVETAKMSGQPLSEREIGDLYDDEWKEELKRWRHLFFRTLSQTLSSR